MTLHVFNPEHDIALARNNKYFTAPTVARRLRSDCGFLPSIWAGNGDYVLVNDVKEAQKSLSSLGLKTNDSTFVTYRDLSNLPTEIDVSPWGWDSSIAYQLKKNGLRSDKMPSDECFNIIRGLSSREFSSEILRLLHDSIDFNKYALVGNSTYETEISEIISTIERNRKSVLKEPWSCSGRGNRVVGAALDTPTENWIRNVIKNQGGIMIEPFYDKIADFGMEFLSDITGVHYRGLSIFTTSNGFYTGNLIAEDSYKEEIIERMLPNKIPFIKDLLEEILTDKISKRYIGPLGVDMMIVKNYTKDNSSPFLHPMVEINLRRTMGHVAIDILHKVNLRTASMHIGYDGQHYKLAIEPTQSN